VSVLIGWLKEHDSFSSRQPALRYIRALLSVARCKPVDALMDLCQINVIDSRLFPAEYATFLYRRRCLSLCCTLLLLLYDTGVGEPVYRDQLSFLQEYGGG